MSNLKAWALVFRLFGACCMLLAAVSLFVMGLGVGGLFAGITGALGLFFMADLTDGADHIVRYFARQNRKAGR